MSPFSAFGLAALYVLVSAVFAYVLYRVIAPRYHNSRPTSTGRRWCAWVVGAATVTLFPRALNRGLDVDAVALWLVGAVVWGAVAFLVGVAWRSFSDKRRSHALPELPSTQARTAPTVSEHMPTSQEFRADADALRADEAVYEQVAVELESGPLQRGLWTRLYAENDGDETRTRVAYIRERAAQITAQRPRPNATIKMGTTTAESTPSPYVAQGADNSPDPALMEAVRKGNWNTASVLLAQGKRCVGVDGEGRTLLDLAAVRKDQPMLQLLRQYMPSTGRPPR